MFGQGRLPEVPDPGALDLGVLDCGVVLVGVVLCPVVAALDPVGPVVPVLVVPGAAAAPVMPAAAPPTASAPATIVAPSILEICIGVSLLRIDGYCSRSIMGAQAKRRRMRV
jgi:hypothetical protein